MVAYLRFFHEIVQKIGKTHVNSQEMLFLTDFPGLPGSNSKKAKNSFKKAKSTIMKK